MTEHAPDPAPSTAGEIPLVDSLAQVARDTTKRMLFGWLLK